MFLVVFLSSSQFAHHLYILLLFPKFISQVSRHQISEMVLHSRWHESIKFGKEVTSFPHVQSWYLGLLFYVFEGDAHRIVDKEDDFNAKSHDGMMHCLILYFWGMQSQIVFKSQLEKWIDEVFSELFCLFITFFLHLQKNINLSDYVGFEGSLSNLTLCEHFFELSVLFIDVVIHFHTCWNGSLAN